MAFIVNAIETVYKGYRFRSRLEARWAVFFDAMGIEWEYEPEGFDLGEAGWYLPDFRLPSLNRWLEIKGGWPSIEDMRKCIAFGNAQHGNGWRFAILREIPNNFACIVEIAIQPRHVWDCERKELVTIPDYSEGTVYLTDEVLIERYGWMANGWVRQLWWLDDELTGVKANQIDHALLLAKQARFEHGQIGAPSDWGK